MFSTPLQISAYTLIQCVMFNPLLRLISDGVDARNALRRVRRTRGLGLRPGGQRAASVLRRHSDDVPAEPGGAGVADGAGPSGAGRPAVVQASRGRQLPEVGLLLQRAAAGVLAGAAGPRGAQRRHEVRVVNTDLLFLLFLLTSHCSVQLLVWGAPDPFCRRFDHARQNGSGEEQYTSFFFRYVFVGANHQAGFSPLARYWLV